MSRRGKCDQNLLQVLGKRVLYIWIWSCGSYSFVLSTNPSNHSKHHVLQWEEFSCKVTSNFDEWNIIYNNVYEWWSIFQAIFETGTKIDSFYNLVNDVLESSKNPDNGDEDEERVKNKNKLALTVIQNFHRSSSYTNSYYIK